jgi:hypothetical protein
MANIAADAAPVTNAASKFSAVRSAHRQEIINPVQTKGAQVGGQQGGPQHRRPTSLDDRFRELIGQDKIVIINLNAFDVIEDIAALVGGTLLNLAARTVSVTEPIKREQMVDFSD